MNKRKFCAVAAAVIALAGCLPFAAGCSADITYTLAGEGDNKYYIASCSGVASALGGTVEISDYIDGIPVKEIAAEGFTNASVRKLVIPATVEKLGNVCFAYCQSLSEIEFEEGSPLTVIPQGAFAYCQSLRQVTLPDGIEKIGPMAFIGDTGLNGITLPETLTEINNKAFENCTGLESIALPGGLKSIGELAFYTTSLTEITIPASVQSVGKGAFHTCTSLKTAHIEARIEVIDSGVFGYCTSLETVYLPATVKQIEGAYYNDGSFVIGHAFHNCAALKDIYFSGSEEEWTAVKVDPASVSENGATYSNIAVINATKHFG